MGIKNLHQHLAGKIKGIGSMIILSTFLISSFASANLPAPMHFEFTTSLDEYKIPGVNQTNGPRRFGATVYAGEYDENDLDAAPVIIFSSGAADNMDYYQEFLSKLAARGFIVIGIKHPYLDDKATIGEVDYLRPKEYADEFEKKFTQYISKELRWRARDISCLIDIVENIDPSNYKPEGECGVMVDGLDESKSQFAQLFKGTENIAVTGHSMGGLTSQYMVSDTSYVAEFEGSSAAEALANPVFEPRAVAAINYDGSLALNYPQSGRVKKPFLYISSADFWESHFLDDVFGDKRGIGKNMVYSRVACKEDSYAILIPGSEHYTAFHGEGEITTDVNYHHQDLTIRHTDVFLSNYLKNENNGAASLTSGDVMSWIYFSGTQSCDQDYSNDSDGDGLSDGDEIWVLGSEHDNADSDGDGIGDGLDYLLKYNIQLAVDDDGDTYTDSKLHDRDYDKDFLTDQMEKAIGTFYWDRDTDGDNVCDYIEVFNDNTNPRNRYNYNWFSALIGCRSN